ncbi:hypothetical protein FQN50_000182 [Emmonsiellopsis sp. PD_5]|nr:hypothetical protein FQN50_000182 [Emmonsiellopsis sp. PD_5]
MKLMKERRTEPSRPVSLGIPSPADGRLANAQKGTRGPRWLPRVAIVRNKRGVAALVQSTANKFSSQANHKPLTIFPSNHIARPSRADLEFGLCDGELSTDNSAPGPNGIKHSSLQMKGGKNEEKSAQLNQSLE